MRVRPCAEGGVDPRHARPAVVRADLRHKVALPDARGDIDRDSLKPAPDLVESVAYSKAVRPPLMRGVVPQASSLAMAALKSSPVRPQGCQEVAMLCVALKVLVNEQAPSTIGSR